MNPEASPQGVFHRRVLLDARPGHCTAGVEDPFHHFIVTIEHDGARVTRVASEAPRTPWTLCAQAGALLERFVGIALSTRPLSTAGGIDPKVQCTHQFDLAALAVAHALRGGRRDYAVSVDDPDAAGVHAARLARDGAPCMSWTLQGTRILDGGPFAGQDMRTVMAWAGTALDDDGLEAAFVLRRAAMVSRGRAIDLDRFRVADDLMGAMAGACFVFRPERAAVALRNVGSSRTGLAGPGDLLAGLAARLDEP